MYNNDKENFKRTCEVVYYNAYYRFNYLDYIKFIQIHQKHGKGSLTILFFFRENYTGYYGNKLKLFSKGDIIMKKNINNVLARGFVVTLVIAIIAVLAAGILVLNPTIFIEEGVSYKLVEFIELIGTAKKIGLMLCDSAMICAITAVIFGVGFLITEEFKVNDNKTEA